MLLPAAVWLSAAMGGRGSRLPALGMTQRWMKSCAAVDGRGLQDMPSRRSTLAQLPDGAHAFPSESAPCVSADAFKDSLHGSRGDRSRPDPPFLLWGAVPGPCRRGGSCGVTCPGGRRGPLPGLTAFPRPTLFPTPCQNPNQIIRPDGCPALPKHKPFPSPTWINSPSPDFYKQPILLFSRKRRPSRQGWQGLGLPDRLRGSVFPVPGAGAEHPPWFSLALPSPLLRL